MGRGSGQGRCFPSRAALPWDLFLRVRTALVKRNPLSTEGWDCARHGVVTGQNGGSVCLPLGHLRQLPRGRGWLPSLSPSPQPSGRCTKAVGMLVLSARCTNTRGPGHHLPHTHKPASVHSSGRTPPRPLGPSVCTAHTSVLEFPKLGKTGPLAAFAPASQQRAPLKSGSMWAHSWVQGQST